MTRLHGTALRVTIFIGENDAFPHRPLSSEIVHRAHKAGLAGRASSTASRASASGARFFAAANVVAGVVAGLGAAFTGAALARAVWG